MSEYYKWEEWYAWRPVRVVQECADPYISKTDRSLVCWVWLRKVHRIKVSSLSLPFGKWIYCLCGQHPNYEYEDEQALIDVLNQGVHCLKGKEDHFPKHERLITTPAETKHYKR